MVMRLLRATPIPDLDPPLSTGPLRRRVEGVVRLPHTAADGGDVVGLIMFAVGNEGAGAMADLRSKHGGHTSARTLLKIHPEASFVVVVTTEPMDQKAQQLAASHGTVDLRDGTRIPVMLILTTAEIVEMAETFEQAIKPVDDRPWWRRLLGPAPQQAAPPLSPLLVR